MKRAFTLIEMVIVIALIAIVVSIVINVFSSLNSDQALKASAEVVKSAIERAQSFTLSSKGDTQYGVHFDSNQVVIYTGATYSSSDTNNVVIPLNSKVALATTTITGGGSEMLFDRLTGMTENYGTTTISLVASSTQKVLIIVSQTGDINSQ